MGVSTKKKSPENVVSASVPPMKKVGAGLGAAALCGLCSKKRSIGRDEPILKGADSSSTMSTAHQLVEHQASESLDSTAVHCAGAPVLPATSDYYETSSSSEEMNQKQAPASPLRQSEQSNKNGKKSVRGRCNGGGGRRCLERIFSRER